MHWILAGLGNPGPSYARHRHNVGFMAVDALAAHVGAGPFREKFGSHIAEARIGEHRVLLMKPMGFMNNSGQGVAEAARYFKLTPRRVLAFHDELDLTPGKVRVKFGGGIAGHNGLRSIRAHLDDDNFWRVRIGIGHPGDKARVHSHVLSDFSKAETLWLGPLLESVARHTHFILEDRDGDFMNRLALDIAPYIEDKEAPAKPDSSKG